MRWVRREAQTVQPPPRRLETVMFREMWDDPVCRFALKASAAIVVYLLAMFGPAIWF